MCMYECEYMHNVLEYCLRLYVNYVCEVCGMCVSGFKYMSIYGGL